MVSPETMATMGSRVDVRRRMKGSWKGALLNSVFYVLTKAQVNPCRIFIWIYCTTILHETELKKTKELCTYIIPAFYGQDAKKKTASDICRAAKRHARRTIYSISLFKMWWWREERMWEQERDGIPDLCHREKRRNVSRGQYKVMVLFPLLKDNKRKTISCNLAEWTIITGLVLSVHGLLAASFAEILPF